MDQNRPFYEFIEQPHIIRVRGQVQHYDWGGFNFIPQLIRQENNEHTPYAELWMGAHPQHPSIAEVSGFEVNLDVLIAANPLQILGRKAMVMFDGKLPYLFKVLDVRQMLSVQVHPSMDQAVLGYERENLKRIPLDAAERNYKDPYHKPELHVALTDFWMLHGFRPYEEIVRMLHAIPAFHPLMLYERKISGKTKDEKEKMKQLYSYVMEMPRQRVNAILSKLLNSIAALQQTEELQKTNPHFWAMRAKEQFSMDEGHMDRGLFSVYLLNLIHIPAGRGTFQPAQVPHAYLEGATVELMANSDNVLRGGLTSKHIDVPELLGTLSYNGKLPHIIKGRKRALLERMYEIPFDGFQLSRIDLESSAEYKSRLHHGPDILLLMKGTAWANSRCLSLSLECGDIIFAPANVPYILRTTHSATLFKATVPL